MLASQLPNLRQPLCADWLATSLTTKLKKYRLQFLRVFTEYSVDAIKFKERP